ncbi:MAG: alginate export family protein [Bacteroidales bacterium]
MSIYEGYSIGSIEFKFANPQRDTAMMKLYEQQIVERFAVYKGAQFGGVMASYYTSRLNLLPFVTNASLQVVPTSENQISIIVNVKLTEEKTSAKSENAFKSPALLPVLFSSERAYLSLRTAAAEMVYINDNTWYAQPSIMTNGNPLATNPSGKGTSAWLEGFASVGMYGVFKLVPSLNLHLYGGASYLASFTAGDEMFTNKARIHADVEDAFVGIVGGKKTAAGNAYKYNLIYGRKSFTLADGWLLINTSMNGEQRAALQLNPRWAADEVFSLGGQWNRYTMQIFSVKPNELESLNSNTTIRGANLELNYEKYGLIGLSYLSIPESDFKYYMPDGTAYSRKGLNVYNLRYYRTTGTEGGLLLKGEIGYQQNLNFDMSALAYYGEVGWNFRNIKGTPTISYRYAHFPGDDPDSPTYNRWDALYTGGNGEQWVQGSIMYKVVQNSNENAHRIQAIYNPSRKWQMVGQFWLFYADQLNNLGGNPALSILSDKFYGTEYNFTVKYFHSQRWYFHLNTAYSTAGDAIKNNVPDSKHWFSAMLFARFSF